MLRIQLWRGFVALVATLPLWMVQRLGAFLGLFLWYTSGRMALVTRENLAICFPGLNEQARDRLGRASMVETGKTILESSFAWRASSARCQAAILAVEGRDAVDDARNLGKGIIFVIPHLGNWEIINHYLGLEFGLTHMFLPAKSRHLNALIQDWRSRTGTRFVPANKPGVRAQLAALKRGGAIGAMPDQEPDVHTGDFAPFFGIPCLTSTLVPNLQARTGAAVFVTWCERLEDGAGFRVKFRPINPATDKSSRLARLNEAMEAAIREVPQQYMWSYKRFRTRPAGELPRYQFRDPAASVAVQTWSMQTIFFCCNLLSLSNLHRLGRVTGDLLRIAGSKRARHAAINIGLSRIVDNADERQKLFVATLRELGRTALETGKIWRSSDAEFDRLVNISGLEYLYGAGTLVLTPPLGNREVVMRALGARYRTLEYYHPNSRTALDDQIRRARSRMGIGLVEHCDTGIDALVRHLDAGHVATLCPDQQPRLRTGEFVPFFDVPALTPIALATLVQRTGANLVLAAAIREKNGFRLMFDAIDTDDEHCILRAVNDHLEQVIRVHPEQYRWSDKRFNIRPAGEPKVY